MQLPAPGSYCVLLAATGSLTEFWKLAKLAEAKGNIPA
jgi:hypothetical protein